MNLGNHGLQGLPQGEGHCLPQSLIALRDLGCYFLRGC